MFYLDADMRLRSYEPHLCVCVFVYGFFYFWLNQVCFSSSRLIFQVIIIIVRRMPDALIVTKFVSRLSTSLFSGAAIYCSLVEHPARLQCGTKLAAIVFPPSFKKAAKIQITLAVISTVSSIVVFHLNGEREWLYAGLIMGFTLPYTGVCIAPTLKYLLDEEVDRESEKTKRELVKWGRLHAVRSALSFLSTLIVFYQG